MDNTDIIVLILYILTSLIGIIYSINLIVKAEDIAVGVLGFIWSFSPGSLCLLAISPIFFIYSRCHLDSN